MSIFSRFSQVAAKLAAYQKEGERPLVLALLGPTATGKTDLAIAFSQALHQVTGDKPVRLINIDSVQCYCELEIGTAKPPAGERELFALMDFLPPDRPYSVASYVQDADKVIKASFAAGQVPLLVGGSMMYYRALERGLAELPESNPSLRSDLQQELASRGNAAMLAELQQVDAPLAARLATNDSQRILRGLEVFRLTGHPLSYLQQVQKNPPNYHTFPIILNPDKSWVNQNIALRLTAMLKAGLVEEVTDLRVKFSHALTMPALRSVGYRQVLDMLGGVFPEHELFDRILFATRQLAKRQRTWLHQWPDASCIQSIKNEDRLCQLAIILERVWGLVRK